MDFVYTPIPALSCLPLSSPDVHLPTAPAPAPPEMHQFQSQLVRVARDALEELPPVAEDADEAAARYMELVSSCKQSSTLPAPCYCPPPSSAGDQLHANTLGCKQYRTVPALSHCLIAVQHAPMAAPA